MKKKIAVVVIVVLVVCFCLFLVKSKDKKDNKNLTLYGNIEIRTVDLSFRAQGEVKKLLKEEGDSVKKGELLAALDDKDYLAQYQKAKAEVERTLALREDALSIYTRNEPLAQKGAISSQTLETMLNNKNRTQAEYNMALAQETFARNELSYTKLYAPEDGIIMVRIQEPGSCVAKGQAIYTMAKTSPVWVRGYIGEVDLGNIKYGQKAKVYTDTIDPNTGKKREYQGTIGYISPVAEFTPKTVQSEDTRANLVYRIRVYIDNTDEFLRQGMPVTIKLKVES